MTETDASLPPELLQAMARYRPYLSPADYQKLLAASNIAAPSAVRVNLLKSSDPAGDLGDWSRRYGWQTSPVPFSASSIQVLSSQTPPGQTLEHRLGYYYVQDAASILPVSLFSPSESPKLVLDMAASPGGKTTQLIDHNHDRDFVIANDSSASRLSALRTVLQIWGGANYAITNFAGERLGDWFPQVFDRVLLDAPCSGLGTLRRRPDIKWKRRRADLGEMAGVQSALLESAAAALRPGGTLVYSVCTITPEETSGVVEGFLEAHPDFVLEDPGALCPLGPPLPQGRPGYLQTFPDLHGVDGMFIARLRKP